MKKTWHLVLVKVPGYRPMEDAVQGIGHVDAIRAGFEKYPGRDTSIEYVCPSPVDGPFQRDLIPEVAS